MNKHGVTHYYLLKGSKKTLESHQPYIRTRKRDARHTPRVTRRKYQPYTANPSCIRDILDVNQQTLV